MNERIENTYTRSGRITNPTEQVKNRFERGRFQMSSQKKNGLFKIFRPVSDLFRPWLKCPETKGFATWGTKFSDLKRVGRNSRFFLQNAPIFCIFVVSSIKRAKHSQPTRRSSDAPP
jgi:hypothetical protein